MVGDATETAEHPAVHVYRRDVLHHCRGISWTREWDSPHGSSGTMADRADGEAGCASAAGIVADSRFWFLGVCSDDATEDVWAGSRHGIRMYGQAHVMG